MNFAFDLRTLRGKAGSPSYRELARRAHYSSTTLSDAAGGRRLPSLEVALAYVRACGGDVDEWTRRWHAVAAETAPTAGRSVEDHEGAPYVGLRAYGGGDAGRFFGRERLADDLLQRIGIQRFVAVFGPSGSGKSSLIRAGLVPRLTSTVLAFTPGAHPIEECAIHFAAAANRTTGAVYHDLTGDPRGLHRLVRQFLTAERSDGEIVIVVDQFEELFTLCHDERERSRFIAMLLTAAAADGSRCRVVIGVRADFYPRCALNPELAEALQDAQVTVGPMTPDELRRAITQPAIQAGCTVESALLTTLVAHTHGRAGVLPMLSHALLETWRRRRGHALTLAGFRASGEFDGALVNTAESVFGTFDERRQEIARDLFLRLTVPGEGTEDTKRKIAVEELGDDPVVAEVVDQLTQARLLVRSRDSLELAHEALIKAWPRLAAWLSRDREGQRVHHELTESAAVWERHDHDLDALLRGTRLAVVRDWADSGGCPNVKERLFLDASLAAYEREQTAKRRQIRRQRRSIAVLIVMLLIAASTTVYATSSQLQATRERNVALALNAVNDAAELSRSVPGVAAQLSLAAYRLHPSPVTRDTLISTAGAARRFPFHPGDDSSPVLAGDGRIVLVGRGGQDRTELWSLAEMNVTKAPRTTLLGGRSASVSADSGTAATAAADGTVRLWDIREPAKPRELATLPAAPGSVALSPNGRILVASSADRTPPASVTSDSSEKVTLWDLADSRRPRGVEFRGLPIRAFAGNEVLVTSTAGETATHRGEREQIWDVSSPGSPTLTGESDSQDSQGYIIGKESHFSSYESVGVSKKGGGTYLVWDVKPPRSSRLPALMDTVDGTLTAVAFSANGAFLATADAVGQVTIRNTWTPREPVHIINLPGRAGDLRALAFEPNGRVLVGISFGENPSVWRWSLDTESAAHTACEYGTSRKIIEEWARYFPDVAYRSPCG
ncbi:hypothetical protein B1H26_39665 [Amycolatopsis sp. BJA-103]|nr:hypothetical protein BKN51_19745 [Amycolatopsis sp. BJA-103]PNE13580.1 hypothetical protein B1H26_39665 [Amycolatopsis sp. BJA-103]